MIKNVFSLNPFYQYSRRSLSLSEDEQFELSLTMITLFYGELGSVAVWKLLTGSGIVKRGEMIVGV